MSGLGVVQAGVTCWQARDVARRVCGEGYDRTVGPWRDAIRSLAVRSNCSAADAATDYLEALRSTGASRAAQVLAIAAGADLVDRRRVSR